MSPIGHTACAFRLQNGCGSIPAMKFYPVFLRVAGRRCMVIGGGEVAERKVESLLAAGAHVVVISPGVTAGLAARAAQGVIEHLPRRYRRGDLEGVCLA